MVAQLTAAELGELYVARESLEAASLAAAVGNASEADFATAIDMNALLEHAIREDDAVAYHRQSRRFHAALTGPSRMYRLLRMLETAWNLTEPVQPMVHVTPDDRIRLHADHGEMLQAFLTRDVERLLGAAERHARRLNSVIATLSFETGLLAAEKDISSPQ
jgi:DNA-binding GntR family transcriptional regulator